MTDCTSDQTFTNPKPTLVASCNLKQSVTRLASLIEYVEEMPQPFHLICIQDPPRNLPWKRRGPYLLWYEAVRPLTETDNPYINPGMSPDMEKRVAFLILKSLDVKDWRIATHDSNSSLVITLRLTTASGEIVTFHNVYNHQNTLNIDQLFDDIGVEPHGQILLGDFNLHHPSWSGNAMRSTAEPKAVRLYDALAATEMELISTRGAITYSRSARSDQYCSTIDLVFGNPQAISWNPRWKIVDVPGFDSDHRVTQTTLDIVPRLFDKPRRDWNRVDVPEVRRCVKKALECLDGDVSLNTTSEIDQYAAKLADLLYAATASTVPLIKPRTTKRNPSQVTFGVLAGVLDEERRVRQMVGQIIEPKQARTKRSCRRRREWRDYVCRTSERPQGSYHMARVAQRVSQPAANPQLTSLEDADKVLHTDTSTMARILRDHLFVDTDDHDPHPIPRPCSSGQRQQHSCRQELRAGEVGKLIDKLKKGKAAGHDQVSNEILKMAKDVVLPYLERLFKACIALNHEPIVFRKAHTVILKKAERKSYTKPKSWRPIALLSSLGKMLEAIIVKRLCELVVNHNLLPAAQLGGAGKCTTRALRRLMDTVHSAHCRKLFATLLSLDITGAYGRVPRARLLEVLSEKGIPDWIIEFVWSFLSRRSTTLDIPGHPVQGPFFVNIGIPQGSTLSPILFQLFAAPMLDRLCPITDSNPDKVALAYVDDTYLLVVSDSYTTNRRILKTLHNDWILAWAGKNDVTFGPEKYGVIHFRGPRTEEVSCVPDIDGLSQDAVKREMRILGVIVDDQLKWNGHVEDVSVSIAENETTLANNPQIKARIRRAMGRLRYVSGLTWGLSLLEMRQLYLAKVRPIISYGCAVWFYRGLLRPRKFSNTLLQQLESKQYQCLVQVAGAFKQIACEYLLKELHIEPIEIYLERCALAHVARSLDPLAPTRSKILKDSKSPNSLQYECLLRHPYHLVDKKAQRLRERAQEHLRQRNDIGHRCKNGSLDPSKDTRILERTINDCARQDAELRAEEFWRAWRTERQADRKKDQPALWDNWGKSNLRYYKNLPRAQCSILLQCRTGVGGLKTHLIRFKVCTSSKQRYGNSINLILPQAADSDKCDCGKRQTAEHLFLYCTRLDAARSSLIAQVGSATTFRSLMQKHTAIAADWAICFFGMPHFEWTRLNYGNTFTEDMIRLSRNSSQWSW